ncbi:NADH-quinone oxidoreductase subunit NuoH [Euzebya tangerina]|uniref:NADH-quinone oxidoreductase subunit NuoH n=1 Tax=Euzebya tangerina TaxID=591198 RepID=UPI000E319105|nr:NADH-quinone oxidoreductase subunit NuoH [Euzebya tangerina]
MPIAELGDWVDFLVILLVVVAGWALFLISTALLIWGERRLVSKMQSRIGPNRLGPFGILQTLADGAKFFFKEDITPKAADKVVYFAAPLVSAIIAMVTFAVVPFGGTFTLADREITLQIWDPQIGLLWPLATGAIGVYGIVLAGWSSGSKYPLLGGVRSSAQMISYELAMGLGAAAVFIYTGSLRASDIVAQQAGGLISDSIPVISAIPAWNIVPMFPAFLLFFIAAVAETQRPPFDLPEAEGELVAGFHTEYSGAKFAMFFLAEFMNVITMSALVVTMFLGGPSGPVPSGDGVVATIGQIVLPVGYFLAKVFIFIFIFIWLRATLPRMRYDRLMDLGWRVMLPLGIVWVFLTGFAVVIRTYARGNEGAPQTLLTWGAVILGVLFLISVVAPLFADRDDATSTLDDDPGSPGDDSDDQIGDSDGGGDAPDAEPEPVGAGAE